MRTIVSLGLIVVSGLTASAADWPRFLGPNGDGTTAEKAPTNWPKSGLKELWNAPLGLGYPPPSIADGKLYHFDRFGDNCRLTCRDATGGKEIWKFEFPTDYADMYGYDSGPRCCPVIDHGRVFVHGPEGFLACVSASDGKPIWTLDTRKTYRFQQNFFGVGSTPCVEGDTLLVAVGGSPPGREADFQRIRPNGTAIVGLNVETGKERFRLGDDLASYSSPIVVTMNDKRVGLYFARGGLVGFDPGHGKELFRHPWRSRLLESVNAANPVVSGNQILLSESYQIGSTLLQWDGTSLKTVWSDKDKERVDMAMLAHWCTPILHDGHIYGSSGRHTNDADVRCVELATGTVKWIETRTTRCTLIKCGDHLLCLGENGELRLIKPNPAKYEEIAKCEVDLAYPTWAPPVVSNGKLYLRGKERLRCYAFSADK